MTKIKLFDTRVVTTPYQDGYAMKAVQNIAARDAIAADHRFYGLKVLTIQDQKQWILDSNLSTWTQYDVITLDRLSTIVDGYQADLDISRANLQSIVDGYQINLGITRSELQAIADGYVDGAGSGAMNRVAYWSDGDTLTSSANFIFDGYTLLANNGTASADALTIQDNGITVMSIPDGGGLRLREIGTPTTPSTDYGILYPKTDGKLYWKNDSGLETDLTSEILAGDVTRAFLDTVVDGYQPDLGITRTGLQTIVDGYQLNLGITRQNLDTITDGYQIDLGITRANLDAITDGYQIDLGITRADLQAITDGYVDGTGATSRVAYWSDADTITSSAALTFDGTTFGIGSGTGTLVTVNSGQWSFSNSTTFDMTNTSNIFNLSGAAVIDGDNRVVAQYADKTAMAAGVGAGVQLVGKYTSGGDYAGFAGFKSMKANATSGDVAAHLVFTSRPSGGPQTERLRIASDGNVGIGVLVPTSKAHIAVDSSASTSGALVVDNASFAVDIFSARDNGTVMLDIPDGGGLRLREMAAPSTPSANYGILYPKTDGKLYWKDDAGSEVDLTLGGGSSGLSLADLQPIVDGYVDGVGSGVADRLALWADGDTITSSGNFAIVDGYLSSIKSANSNSPALVLHNLDTTSSATAGTGIDFRLATTTGEANSVGRLLFGKTQTWTSTSTTQDGYVGLFLTVDGVPTQRFRIDSNGQTQVASGSAPNPAYTFLADPTTGMYYTSSTLNLSVAGQQRLTMTTVIDVGGSTAFRVADGTQSLPSYTFSNDTDMGIYRVGENQMSVVTGANTRMSFSGSASDGYVTIGDGYGDQLLISGYIQRTPSGVAYATTTNINFASASIQTISLTGNVTFTTSNLAAGRTVTIKISADGSTRNLTFPAWKFVGAAAPTSIAAGKTALLSLIAFDTTDASVIAAYSVEP